MLKLFTMHQAKVIFILVLQSVFLHAKVIGWNHCIIHETQKQFWSNLHTQKEIYMAAEANSRLPTILTSTKDLKLGNFSTFLTHE